MRREPLLTAVPPVPVESLGELYAIAFDQAQKATQRYGALATQPDERLRPVRAVFAVLSARERERCDGLSAACLAACGKRPDESDLRWAPIDLVAASEIADIGNSSLATPYTAGTTGWTLANAPSDATLSSVSVAGSAATLTLAEGPGAASTAVGSFTEALAPTSGGVRDANGHRSSFSATAPSRRVRARSKALPELSARRRSTGSSEVGSSRPTGISTTNPPRFSSVSRRPSRLSMSTPTGMRSCNRGASPCHASGSVGANWMSLTVMPKSLRAE